MTEHTAALDALQEVTGAAGHREALVAATGIVRGVSGADGFEVPLVSLGLDGAVLKASFACPSGLQSHIGENVFAVLEEDDAMRLMEAMKSLILAYEQKPHTPSHTAQVVLHVDGARYTAFLRMTVVPNTVPTHITLLLWNT